MKTNKSNRLLALFLCLMMLLGTVPLSGIAFAAAPCPNHTAHDAACGYIEAVEGHACGHTHDEACEYSEGKEGTPCQHEQGEHDETCGYQEGAGEIPCDKGCSETGEDGAIVHAEGCAYTPAVEGAECSHKKHDGSCGYAEAVVGAACKHEHDTACGYVEAVEGHACGHTCELCNGAEKVMLLGEAREATCSISGTVTQVDYITAIPGITVTLWQNSGQISSTTTDQEGKYAFTSLAPGEYEVRAGGQASDGSYYAEDNWYVTISDRDAIDWDFNLNPGNAPNTYSISGCVWKGETTDGLIIGVTLWQGEEKVSEVNTNNYGEYTFSSLSPGTYTVKVGGGISGGVYYIKQSQTVTIDETNPEGSCWFSLEPGNAPNTYSISGRVIQTNSNTGLYRLKVTLWVGDKMIDSVSTNRNGDYSFNSLEPGDYTVKAGGKTSSANPIDYIEQSKTVTVISENQTCSFELQPSDPDLRVYSITGSVSKVNGEGPLPALKVTLWRDGEQIDEVETKMSGDYTFYSVKPGLYLVKAGGLDKRGIYYAMESRPVIITDKNKEDFSFDLEPGAAPNTYTISGHVALYNCPSRPGMPVKLWTEGIDQPIQSATTNDVGAFTFTSVAAGEYTVKAGGLIDGILYTEDSEAVTISNQNATGVVLFLKASPSAPQNFTASPGNNQVALSWTAPQSSGSEAITKYEVSKDGGASWVTATSNTGHTFTNLTNGQSYTFKVRAVNGVGAGAAATATATPTVPGPSAPQNFNTTYANTILNLSWKAPASDGGSPIVKYQYSVTKGGEPDNWQDIPGSNASTTSYTVTGLTNLTNYTVKLRAVNSTSIGEAVSDTFYLEPSSPGAVRNLTAIPGDGQMTLTWEKPENDGGSPITHYQYRYNVDPNSSGAANQWSRIPDSGPDTVSFTITGLENGVELAFFVRAYSAYGMGDHAMVMATPQAASTVPTAPRNFTATPGDRQVALSWEAPASSGGAAITGYEVSKDNGTSWMDATSSTGHTFDNLTNGQSYTFQVRAVNSAGKGAAATATATPQAAPTVPGAPRNFTATPGDRQVALSWEAPQSNGGATITKYEVSSNGGTTWTDATSSTSHTFDNLTNGQSYTFQVRAVNSAGKGAPATATATPQAAPTVPGAPRNFTATPGDRQVALSWEAPASNGGAAITKYEVSSNGGTTWTDATSATGHTFGNLTNGQSYTFQVRAVNSAGKGTAATATATPQAAPTVPGAPRNFTATPGDRQVALSWEAPASNGGATITKYEVSSNGGTTWTDATSATGHTFGNLTNGQSYTFQVRAVNSAGKGTAATATATPQAAPTVPTAPRNFTATPGDRQVALSWEAPASNGGATITKYEVSSNGGTTWVDATSATGHTFDNLTNGQSYTFLVRAINSAGKGAAATATATPQAAATVPGAPRNFAATPGDRQVVLSWEAPASNGGAAITGYEVSSNGGTNWTNATGNTSHTFTGLTNSQSYTFKVRAVNNAGKGTAASIMATPQAAPTAPGAPRNFTATPGDRQVVLSWTAPASNGGAEITGYEVSSNGGTNWTNVTGNTSHTFTGLTNSQSYTFKVRAVNSAGKGTAASITATPQAAPTVPGAPRNFTATPGDRQVVLSWTAPASNGGAEITGYEVSSDGGTNWTNATDATGHTFTGLTNGQSYTFQVRAVNSAGKGTAATATATPQAAPTVPGAPRNFTVTPGDRQVVLSWEAPASNGGAAITKYEVSSNGGTTWVDATSATGHTFDNLTNGQSYAFQVRAVNSAGKGMAVSKTATPQAAAPNLTGITAPDAITGVANGTLLSNIRLPDHVAITTTQGGKQATVIWNRGQQTPTYDPTSKAAQTFTVSGTVTLPVSVTNTGNIPLSVQISVTVAAEDADAITGVQIVNKPGKLTYTEGDALDLSGLTVKLNFSKSGEKTVGLSECAANHITVSPANGAKLSRGDTTVTVSAGGKSDSFPITVNAMQRVQTPAFSPAGGTYSSARDVKITCGTAGANIYYTTNGDTPTAASSRYTGNIRVSSTTTIQAVAIKDGMEDSAVASATFTIRRPPDDDDSPSGGGGGGSYTPPETQNTYTAAGDNITQAVSRSDLRQLENNGKSLTIQNGTANMTFEPAALKAILAAIPSTARNVTFSSAPADLSAFPEAAKLIGNRPVYAFTISYQDSRGKTVTAKADFPAGAVSIALDYTPAAGEAAGSLFMVYVDDKGAVTWLDKSSYADGKMLAEVSHFSVYGVAYKAPAPVFADIAGHWAKADIEFVAARGLLSGTGNGQFSPNGTMTRGMFVTALGRLAGVNPQSYKTRSFTDVKADAYYAAYVEWAAQNNIVKGTGDKLFSPDAPVTREQMAVMMTNYAGQMGYSIPAPLAAVTFTDNNKIGAWAAKEVAAMQRAGIIKGKDGGRFDPQASATRAEVSAVLRRFVEIVIDPATAQGWVKNDSGQWLYYKDGKALTGWQKIGGNWYYFYSTGAMAVNTKIDGYVIGPDGKRKEED